MRYFKILTNILDLIFSSTCKICNGKLVANRKVCICSSCWSKIKIIRPPMCVCCGKQLKETENFCADCSYMRLSFVDNRSVGIYEGVLKEAIHLFKYKYYFTLGKYFGKLMVNYIKKNGGTEDINCIVPVPMYKKKINKRELNHSEILAKFIADYFKIPLFTDVLIRTRETIPQHELDKQDRLLNVKGAFDVVNKEKIKWACVLLVDDILTTGATADECSQALLANGAHQIRVFTLARGM